MPPVRRIVCVSVLVMGPIAPAAWAQGGNANGYPTVDRVEFVLECMERNGSRQEFLYKCACVIDHIAAKLSYDDFVESGTAARYQSLPGDRGGEFRDPPETRTAVKQYLQIQSDAKKQCNVPR